MAEHKSQEEIDREYEEIEKTIREEQDPAGPARSGSRGGPPELPEEPAAGEPAPGGKREG